MRAARCSISVRRASRCCLFLSSFHLSRMSDTTLSALVSVSRRANTNVTTTHSNRSPGKSCRVCCVCVSELQTEWYKLQIFDGMTDLSGSIVQALNYYIQSELTLAVILSRKIPLQWLTKGNECTRYSPKTKNEKENLFWTFLLGRRALKTHHLNGIFEPWKFRLPPATQITAAINNKLSDTKSARKEAKKWRSENEWLNKYVMKENRNGQQPSTSHNLFYKNKFCLPISSRAVKPRAAADMRTALCAHTVCMHFMHIWSERLSIGLNRAITLSILQDFFSL